MKIGIIISSNDVETCWNALRYANFAIGQKDMYEIIKESDEVATF